MKPRTTIRIKLSLPASAQSIGASAPFRSYIAGELQTLVDEKCTQDWLAKQEIRFLQHQEKERQMKFKELLQSRKNSLSPESGFNEAADSDQKMPADPTGGQTMATPSKKAPVATKPLDHESEE